MGKTFGRFFVFWLIALTLYSGIAAPPGVPAFLQAPVAQAGAKTKTITWFIGSNISTTAVASAATTTFAFTINIPDIVPTAQPIRSAYIMYNTHWNNTTAISASTFTLFKQGGAAQALTAPTALNSSSEELQLGLRLDATSAMRTIVGSASGTYAMYFTANLTGPTRISEGAELVVTYDYDPDAPTQVNTVYHHAFSTSTQISTSIITSPSFDLDLPEASVTSTAITGASSTNQFWIEYRGRISGASVVTTVGWDSETTSTTTFTQAGDSFSFLLLVQPKTGGASPSAAHTFKMLSDTANGISGPNAIAIATYTFDYSSSATLRKTLKTFIMQSILTATSTQLNTTSTIVIPETAPSSTNAFLWGRSVFTTAANPGMNATSSATGGCTFLTPTAITEAAASTDTTGYVVVAWDVTNNLRFTTNGTKTVCSSFSSSAAANIRSQILFWSYDYTKVTTAGSRTNQNVSFMAASNTTAGTTFSNVTIDATLADASSTANVAWLDAEYSQNGTGNSVAAQTLTLGDNGNTADYAFVNTGENTYGESFFLVTTSTPLTPNMLLTLQCAASCVSDSVYNVHYTNEITAANLTQAHYHWRYDNGSESAATQAANEDVSTTTAKGTNYRLRFEVSNEGDASSTAALRIEYQQNATSGAWTQFATSSVGSAHWQMASSSQVANNASTTNIAVSSGGATDENLFFQGGQVTATTTTNQAATTTLTGLQFTETEFAIKATTNAVDGATYYFRLTNASATLGTYSIFASSTVPSGNSAPSVSSVSLNHGNAIVLTANATTSFNINYTITDTDGCADIVTNNGTSTAFRSGIASTCAVPGPATSNLNCYLFVTRATSSCSVNSINATDTVQIYYFAQATDASSSFASDNWTAYALAVDAANATGSATSSAVELNTLLAIDVVSSTISYGTVTASSTTGATNVTSTIRNAGNASTTIKVSGTALGSGSQNIATSSQHYATSSFTFGGLEQLLTDTLTAVTGFLLTSPTSTSAVASDIFWGFTVPAGYATGTYTGVNTFSAVFEP